MKHGEVYDEIEQKLKEKLEALVEDKFDIIDRLISTNIQTKRKYFPTFSNLIANQFNHGGEKYLHTIDKEFTDVICEFVPGETGVDWILGTVMKYLGRFKNFQREKDLLKIATYCYIMWLKLGFHLNDEHDEDIKVK